MDTYDKFSKEKLIEKINELEFTVEILKKEKNQRELLQFPWVGNLGHWHWNIKTDNLICNDSKILALNYTRDEIPKDLGFEFFTSKLHPQDYERVMDNMRQHLRGNTDAYEVEYRIKTQDNKWKWYYDRGLVSKKDDNNEAIQVSGIVFDITKSKEMELLIRKQNKRLEHLVEFDCLTKIFNRRGLFQKLESELYIAKQTQQNLSVIMLDIDKFKSVNDNYGHLVGDKILKQIAKDIKKNMLGKDIVGRYGGEEFLVILPNTNKEKAYIVAERIRKSIQNKIFINNIKITISGGINEFNGQSIKKLIDIADQRLYQAKENGRNQIFYD